MSTDAHFDEEELLKESEDDNDEEMEHGGNLVDSRASEPQAPEYCRAISRINRKVAEMRIACGTELGKTMCKGDSVRGAVMKAVTDQIENSKALVASAVGSFFFLA